MPEQAAAVNPLGQMLPLVLIFLVFYFLLIRPQRKQQKEQEQVRNDVKKNDAIVTAGGMHGVVTLVKEKTVVIRVDDNSKIEFDKEAISRVVKK